MEPVLADMAAVRRVSVSLIRDGKSAHAVVGGGTRLERILGALTILKWNREGRRIAAKKGVEFPMDAPIYPWQVNWPSVLQRGNI